MNRRIGFLCAGVLGFFGAVIAGCGGSAAPSPVTGVTIAGSTTTLEQGQAATLAASVSTTGGFVDTAVTWSLSSSGCSGATCGSLANETGTSVTYNAPASVPSNLTVTVTATSVADPSKSASINISVAALTVTITDKANELAAGSQKYFFKQFLASVQNDPANAGVTWTLTANGTPCSPGCGTVTVSPNNSFDVNYTPPATAPAAPANMPTLTATSVTDASKSDSDAFTIFDGSKACPTGGNESILQGNYAIMTQGWSGSSVGTPIVYAASFTADGTGKITFGQDQFTPYTNYAYGGEAVIAGASSYSVGPDNRGCLTLTDQDENTFTLQFALGGVAGGVASKGDVILFDNQSGIPLHGSGILRQQDPTAFSLSALQGNYAFGVDGWDNSSGTALHYALAGSFIQSGGNISGLTYDNNDGGMVSTSISLPPPPGGGGIVGTLGPIGTLTGETSISMLVPGGKFPATQTIVIYIINSSELFVVSLSLSGEPEFAGVAIAAPSSAGASSISSNYIFRFTGTSAGSATASIGLANFSGGSSGTISGTLDSYVSGMASTGTISGNYSLDTQAPGRLVINGSTAGTSPTCYLTTPLDNIAAFCVSTDGTAGLGILDAQPSATYNNSSLSGKFFFGGAEPADDTTPDISGVASISAGNLTGTKDASTASGFSLGSAFSSALSINSNGLGTLGPNTVAVTNGTLLFFLNEANGAPAQVQVFEP